MKRIIIVIFSVLICRASLAWSNMGHEVIIEVAKRHLREDVKKEIERYMPYDITQDARWMDKHRSDPELLYMFHFHEQCINLKTLEYDPNPQIEEGDIMRGLCLARYNLSHRDNLSDSTVVLNIRMIIHFIGDLHCPVHLGVPGIWFPKPPYRQDVGKWYFQGNALQSFHKFIDRTPGYLFPDMKPSEIASLIDDGISKRQSREWVNGDFVDWTNDAAQRGFRIYNYFPPLWDIPDSPDPKYIPDDFLENTREIIIEELLKAGYQLAYVLNACF